MIKEPKIYEYFGKYGTFSVKLKENIFEILHDGLDREMIFGIGLSGTPYFVTFREIIRELFWNDIYYLFPPITTALNDINYNGGPYVTDYGFTTLKTYATYEEIEEYEENIEGYYVKNENCTLVININESFVEKGDLYFYKPKFYKYQGEYGTLLIRINWEGKIGIPEISLNTERIYRSAHEKGVLVSEIYKEILTEIFKYDLTKYFPIQPSQNLKKEKWAGRHLETGYELINPDAYSIRLEDTGITIFWNGEFKDEKKNMIKRGGKPIIYIHESPCALLAVQEEKGELNVIDSHINIASINELAYDLYDPDEYPPSFRGPAYLEILYDLFKWDKTTENIIDKIFIGEGMIEERSTAYFIGEEFALTLSDFELKITYDREELYQYKCRAKLWHG